MAQMKAKAEAELGYAPAPENWESGSRIKPDDNPFEVMGAACIRNMGGNVRAHSTLLLGATLMATFCHAPIASALELGIAAGGSRPPASGLVIDARLSQRLNDWFSIMPMAALSTIRPDSAIYFSSKNPEVSGQALRLGLSFVLTPPIIEQVYARFTPGLAYLFIDNSYMFDTFNQAAFGISMATSEEGRFFIEVSNGPAGSTVVMSGYLFNLR